MKAFKVWAMRHGEKQESQYFSTWEKANNVYSKLVEEETKKAELIKQKLLKDIDFEDPKIKLALRLIQIKQNCAKKIESLFKGLTRATYLEKYDKDADFWKIRYYEKLVVLLYDLFENKYSFDISKFENDLDVENHFENRYGITEIEIQ